MARPRKARAEGETAAVDYAADFPADAEVVAKKNADPVPGDNGAALTRISEYFQAEFPDEWAEWRLCPLEAGLVAMAAKLG